MTMRIQQPCAGIQWHLSKESLSGAQETSYTM